MLETINENINVGNALGVLGILVGYYFYAKSRLRDRIHYVVKEVSVVGVSDPSISDKLEIIFNGKNVPRVTSSRLLVWNTGSTVLSPDDFLNGDALGVYFKDGGVEILDAALLTSDAPENAKELRPGGHGGLLLDYEVIRPTEGFVVEVLHSGATGRVELSGRCRRTSRLIYRSATLFDSDELFHPMFPLKRIAFPIALVLMALFFSYVAGKAAFGLMLGLSKLVATAKDAGYAVYGFDTFATADAASSVELVAFGVVVLFFCQDLYRGWRTMPSRKIASAFRR